MKKKILMVLFLGLFLFGISKADSQASDVIMVSTPEQLDNIRNNLSGNYQLANDIDMSKYYNFEPIGNENDGAFTGSFDGNGHTIKNLPLDYDTYKYVGLFGYLDGPVYNVTLENVDVKSSRYGGGIAGYADTNGTIRNCVVSGTVEVDNSYFSTYSGGIVGYSNAEITGCESDTYIISIFHLSLKEYAGGIAGYSLDKIDNCINRGNIKGGYAFDYLGGIVGASEEKVSNSINFGDSEYNYKGGGIVGSSYNTEVSNCENNGDGFHYGIGGTGKNCINSGEIFRCGKNFGMNFGRVRDYNSEDWVYGYYNYPNYKYMYNIPNYFGTIEPDTISKPLSQILNDESFDKLDPEIWERDPEWNSGLPMMKDLPKHLELSEVIRILDPGESFQLKARLGTQETSDLSWESVNASLVSVSPSGKVTAVGKTNGSATITAKTSEGYKMNCTVFVYDKKPTSVYIADQNNTIISEANMKVGEQRQLNVQFNSALAESKITWTSSNSEVTSVNDTGLVTGKKFGKTTITAVTDNGCKAQITVTIKYGESLTLDKTQIKTAPGNSCHLKLSLLPEEAEDSFSLSIRNKDPEDNSSVSWYNQGYSSATKEYSFRIDRVGEYIATVTTTGGLKAECEVTVTSFSIPSSVSVNMGNTKPLDSSLSPKGVEQQLTWSSTAEDIASVDENGIVTAIKPGTAAIKAVSDVGMERSCLVTVTGYANKLILNKNTFNMAKGTTDRIIPSLLPEGSTDSVSYSSSNSSVAYVDSNGLITARSAGSTQITVTTSQGLKQYCSVVVQKEVIPVTEFTISKTKLSLLPEQTAILTTEITPSNATNTKVTWTSSNEEVATVNQGGTVTAIHSGTAQITASLGNGFTRTCTVTVKKLSSAVISVKNMNTEPGDIVEVPLMIEDNPGIAVMKLSVKYDAAVLTPVKVEKTELLGNASITGKEVEQGIYNIIWNTADDITGNGTFAMLSFKVNANASRGNSTKIILTSGEEDVTDASQNTIRLSCSPGTITIKDNLYGDVYEDGKLNSHDILSLQRYLTELETFTARQKLLADITRDETVNMQDLVALVNKVVSIPVQSQTALFRTFAAKIMALDNDVFTIHVGNKKVEKDTEYVDIPIDFKNCPGIAALRFKVNYDKERMSLVSVTGKQAFATNLLYNTKTSDGKTLVTWYADKDVKQEGTVVVLRFKINKDSLQSASPISLEWENGDICNQTLGNILAAKEDGSVMPADKEVNPEPGQQPSDNVNTPKQPSQDNNAAASTQSPKQETSLKKGTKITEKKSKAVYKVNGNKTVEYNKVDKKAKTSTIPTTIKVNGVNYRVTAIAPKAFVNNKNLKKVVIPASVRSIGKQAFSGCKNLKTIVIQTPYLTKKSVGIKAFKGIHAKATIKVPKKQKKAYQKLLKTKGLGKKVKIK